MNIIIWVLCLFMAGILVFIMLCMGVSFYLNTKYSAGWIYQDNHGIAYKEILKEENGCIYFVDVLGNEGKVCGSYSVKTLKPNDK